MNLSLDAIKIVLLFLNYQIYKQIIMLFMQDHRVRRCDHFITCGCRLLVIILSNILLKTYLVGFFVMLNTIKFKLFQ